MENLLPMDVCAHQNLFEMSYDHAKHFVEQLMTSEILYILISMLIDALSARKRQFCVRIGVKLQFGRDIDV